MRLNRSIKKTECRITVMLGIIVSGSLSASVIPPLPFLDLDPVVVIGSPAEIQYLAGSGYVLDDVTLEQFQYQDIHQVLARVPGVYVRQEDGFGLFPNISLRGSDPGRSGKVTLMEDSIPIAPAPYSAPAAYFSPTLGRMASIEVLKGSSQVRFGPHTTGGVINYLSTPIPPQNQTQLTASFGSFGQVRLHGTTGGMALHSEHSSLHYLLELHHEQVDGFKTIRPAAGGAYAGSDNTGYERTDAMLKVEWKLGSHALNLKLGYTELDSRESYLGLNEVDFAKDPYERYAASRFDEINADHKRMLLTYSWNVSEHYQSVVKLYSNRFHRNWYKLDQVNGQGLSSSLSLGSDTYQVLDGGKEGTLKVKANNRTYRSNGIQWLHQLQLDLDHHSHALEAGLLFHSDSIRRYQHADVFAQEADGSISGLLEVRGPDREGNRKQVSDVATFYVVDRIQIGNLRLEPGLRYEQIDWEYWRADGRPSPTLRKGDTSIFAPGVGMNYVIAEGWSLFAGLHRGVSPVSPSGAASGLEEERSQSVEFGIRGNQGDWAVELVGFHTDFENLVTSESVANGGNDANIGQVRVSGLEWMLSRELLAQQDQRLVVELSGTYTRAEIVDPTDGQSDPESIFFGAVDGSRIPYIPEWMLQAGLHYSHSRWSAGITAAYTGSVYGTADNRESDPDDIRVGRVGSRWVVDAQVNYQINESWNAFLVARNVLDEVAIASRLPHGLRATLPRSLKIGLTLAL